jgi:hypothetical protein
MMLKPMKNHFLLLLCVGLLAACVNAATKTSASKTAPVAKPIEAVEVNSAKSTAAVKVVPIKSIDATEYLIFAEEFSNMNADAQKQALAQTNQALTINPNDLLHRMKLVMIYGLPSSTLPDTVKAQQLLQKVLQEDILANSQLAFANLLFDHLTVANKVGKNNNGDNKRADALQQKNEALQGKLDVTQQKLEAAQQKLDELRKIEKSMGERDVTPKK